MVTNRYTVHRVDDVQEINIKNLVIEANIVDAIRKLLEPNYPIDLLSIRNCDLNGNLRGILDMVRSFQFTHGIRHIEFQHISFGHEDFTHFISFVRSVGTVEHISIQWCVWNNSCSDQAIARMISVLHGTRLEGLHFDATDIGPFGSEALADAIPHMNLKLLRLSYCNIAIRNMCKILKAVKGSNIGLLDISGNSIGNFLGPKAVCVALQNPNLNVLHLRECSLNSRGLGLIVPAISKSIGIKMLSLCGNTDIQFDAIANMLNAIGYHPTLKEINAVGCDRLYLTIVDFVNTRLIRWARARRIITMLSARVVKRIGYKSYLSMLPTELFRMLFRMLK